MVKKSQNNDNPFDFIAQDPPALDHDHPPALLSLTIPSGGHDLLAVAYVAGGPGPHATVILVHGIPGDERNGDLAHLLHRAGYNVLLYHPRGAWGSGGVYRFAHVLEDASAVIAFCREAKTRQMLRAHPDQLAIVGHSLGGWAALMAAAQGHIAWAASLAGVNMGAWAESTAETPANRQLTLDFLHSCLPPLRGATAEGLLEEMLAHAQAWDTQAHIGALAACHLLLLAAERDQDVPPALHHAPLVTALERSGAPGLRHAIIPDADHGFLLRRVALAQALVGWLNNLTDEESRNNE